MGEIALLGLVMILGLGAYWSMVIFPRQRDFAKREKAYESLRVGDEVITYGGVVGKLMSIEPENGLIQLEVAPGVVMRILPASIARTYDPAEFAEAEAAPPNG